MKKIKVLFIVNSLAGGGAERVLSYILNNLDRNKFEISLITFLSEKDYNISEDIEYYSFDKKTYFDLVNIIFKLSKIFRSDKYNLVVSFLTYTNIFVTISWLLSGKKIPLIISERSNPKNNLKNQKFSSLKMKLVSLLYPLPTITVAVSKGVKENLANEFNIPISKIQVIYNPLDFKKIDELKKEIELPEIFDNNIIISCGRLTKEKNYPLLIKAFNVIIKKGINAILVILGKGKEKKNLEKLVNQLKLKDKVFFLGFQTNPYKFMNNATIFVLSSSWEGFPNVLLEAMACGVPVISTDCASGPNEIIQNGRNGFLVPVDDEKKLAKAMEKLLNDIKLREKFSSEGRRFVESKFKMEKIIKKWEDLFLEVAK